MKIVIISNFMNHHQCPLAIEIEKLLGKGNYYFIETEQIPEERREQKYQGYDNDFLVKAYSSKSDMERAGGLIFDADVVIYGSGKLAMLTARDNSRKPTFFWSERIFKGKNIVKNIIRYLKWFYIFHIRFHSIAGWLGIGKKARHDFALLGCPGNKIYPFVYLPEIQHIDIEAVLSQKRVTPYIQIFWAGRYLWLKHVEIIIETAKRLVNAQQSIRVVLVGTGPEEQKIRDLVRRDNLQHIVTFKPACPPTEVRRTMLDSDIYLFPSDNEEGWGAVVNEAMNSGCVVVASDAPGASTALIQDGVNGFIFKSEDVDECYQKTLMAVQDAELRRRIGMAAYKTMTEEFSPAVWAKKLVQFCQNVTNNTYE